MPFVQGEDSLTIEKTTQHNTRPEGLSTTTQPKAVSVKSRPKPTADQAKRIVKIFQQKFG